MRKDTLAGRVDGDIRTRLATLTDAFGRTRHASVRDGSAQTIAHDDVLAEFDRRFRDKTAG